MKAYLNYILLRTKLLLVEPIHECGSEIRAELLEKMNFLQHVKPY